MVLADRQALIASLIIQLVAAILLFIVRLFFGMSFYILSDRPELTFTQILAESNRLMTGRRLKFFLLALRMIPVLVLGTFAFVIGVLWPITVYNTALANFYLDAVGEEPYNPLRQQEPQEPTNSTLLT